MAGSSDQTPGGASGGRSGTHDDTTTDDTATGSTPSSRAATTDDTATSSKPASGTTVTAARVRLGAFIAAGLLVAGALAFFVSPQASSQPDGLNKVAIEEGFADTEEEHHFGEGPTAGYELDGVDDEGLSKGFAGVVGVAITFAVCGGLVLLLRRTQGRSVDGSPTTGGPATSP